MRPASWLADPGFPSSGADAVGRQRAAGLDSCGSRARRGTAEGAEARKSRRRRYHDLQARRVSRANENCQLEYSNLA